MNQLAVFENHEVMILFPGDVNFKFEGEFIVHAGDFSKALEYSKTENVYRHCKEKHIYNVKNGNISDSLKRGIRKLNNAGENFISSLSLNRVLGKSDQPKAERFQDWLYEEMLPSVQKHGAYLTADKIEEVLTNPETLIKLASVLKEEREKRIAAEQRALEYSKKANYVDVILQSKGTVTTSQIAKDYGLSAQELNDILNEERIQYKQNGQWLLYQKYANKGYTMSHTIDIVRKNGEKDFKMNTRWTQRGRLFIHDILTKRGIKANIDKDYSDVK